MQLGLQLVLVVGLDPQGVGLAALDDVARLVAVALEVILVDDIRRDVDPGIHVVPGAVEHRGVAVGVAVDLIAAFAAGHIGKVTGASVVTGTAVIRGVLQAAAAQVLGRQFEHAEHRVE
ncbi:hypothetical protein D3C81_1095130 [compost metagenome]